jgi:superfamily I DNA/RNA helicase
MKLTTEQLAIINSTGNIIVNAVAGSGKTTTIIEYAKARPRSCKILYLVFNRSVKEEAIRKFISQGLSNVTVETAHSLAYRHIYLGSDYKLKHNGYKSHEIIELLHIENNREKYTEFIIANHILKMLAYFCNSDKKQIQEIDYLSTITDRKARAFATSLYPYIEQKASILLSKMDKGEIEITHDFYLKKFQLSNPTLNYDYILFDEGQDASMVMLDVFLKQKATKVIVGDTHQQIYSWRYAVNSLEMVNFKTYSLTTSFRFNQDIANLAVKVIEMKKHIDKPRNISIDGVGRSNNTKIKAVLARTNLGLLVKAIEYVTEKRKVKRLHFEGNINSYTYATDGASLYDVLSLCNNNHYLIKDKLIKKMNNLEDLVDYIEKTEDRELGMMVDIVREYGNEIPTIIQSIKDKHVDNKDEAEIVFSTVHRSKGMEYDVVQIVNDFVSEELLIKQKENNKEENNYSPAQINEEINLLYVAITRTRNRVYVPKTLMPTEHPHSPKILVMKPISKEIDNMQATTNMPNGTEYKYLEKVYDISLNEAALKYSQTQQYWTDKLDKQLMLMYYDGITLNDIANHFGRTVEEIKGRVKELGI